MPILFCPSCDASNPTGSRFCEECGHALDAGPETPAKKKGDAVDRSLANRELGRARRVIERLKLLYVVLATINGLAMALCVWLAAVVGKGLEIDGLVSLLWLMAAIYAVLTAVFVVGRLRLHKEPFVWGVVAAAFQTLSAVFGGSWLPLVILNILLAVACWYAVSLLVNVRKLVKKYPELRATKRVLGQRTAPDRKGRIGQQLAETRSAERRKRLAVIGGIAAVVVLLIATRFVFSGGSDASAQSSSARPATPPRAFEEPSAPLEPRLREFERAWVVKDVDAIGALYPERLDGRRQRLAGRFEKHGMTGFAELGGPEVRLVGDNKKRAYYETIDGPATVTFEFEDGRWVMTALRF